MTNKDILKKALLKRAEHLKYKEYVIKHNLNWKDVRLNIGIYWGKDKEYGNLFHAYCEFCGKLFEDGATYKQDCIKYARKKGWIIGTGKKLNDIAVCLDCKNKLKGKTMTNTNLQNIDFLTIEKKEIDKYDEIFDKQIEKLTGLNSEEREAMSYREWREMMETIKKYIYN